MRSWPSYLIFILANRQFAISNCSLLFSLIAVGLNRAKKDKQNSSENKPLVIAKPIVFNDNKIQTVTETNIESDLEKITLNETAASG